MTGIMGQRLIQSHSLFGQKSAASLSNRYCPADLVKEPCFAQATRGLKQRWVCQAQRNSGSNLIAQEILLFCFQQDLESTLVRALNTDQQELAQDLREKLQSIDAVVQEVQALKASSGGDGDADTRPPDFADSFRLRTNLQEAIMEERYEEAARLRDELRILQEKLDAATGRADEASLKLKQQRKLRLGQRVIHSLQGYRGLVCGWDSSCTETEEWQEQAGIAELSHGAGQPFYQLLVDIRDAHKVGDRNAGLIAYVPQELLQTPQPHECWGEDYGGDGFTNPFKFKLFLGRDERGDFLPARSLREKYSQERRDVYPDSSDEDEGDDDTSDASDAQSLSQRAEGMKTNDIDLLDRLFVQTDDDLPEDGKPSK